MAEAKNTKKETVKKAEKSAVKTTTKKVKELVETEAIAEAIVEAQAEINKEELKTVAKAGKRSVKATKEAEEKAARELRKAEAKAADNDEKSSDKPKVAPKTARPKIERRSKNYRKSADLIDKTKQYKLTEAIDIISKTSTVKFDAAIELHVRLGVDPRQADENIRGTVVLPGGTGKSVRVAVFAEVDDIAKAKKAGADIAAGDEFLQQLDKEKVDFDVLIATPTGMAKLGKYARLLGPKGLMPNPKSGTVTTDVAKAVQEAKGGKVEYRVDSNGIVHVAIGKISFTADKLVKNAQAVLIALKNAKPASLKGTYVKSIYVTSTMGPSIQIDNNEL